MSFPQVFAFGARYRDDPHETVINTTSAGKARYEYLMDVREVAPDATFADIRVRKLGPAHTSEQFTRTAAYRGMPNVRCGQRVIAFGAHGVIVGHNDSANFEVQFAEDSEFKGGRGNVHPCDIRLVGESSSERGAA